MKKSSVLLMAIVLGLSGSGFAQSGASEPKGDVFYFQQGPAGPPPLAQAPEGIATQRLGPVSGNVGFISIVGDGKPVVGAPYTATAVTTTAQELADGNRIVNKSTTLLARDSEGRTRREEQLGGMGSLPVKGPKMAFIHDPVAGLDYVLNIKQQTSQVIHLGKGAPGPDAPMTVIAKPGPADIQQRVMVSAGPGEVMEKNVVVFGATDKGHLKTESLGSQVIEGVLAEGRRVTHTIPAGEVGNERPLVITSEVWTSPELHAVVLSKRNDPRFGETVYRLTDISRTEPDASLFQVPSSFTQTDASGPVVRELP